MDCEQTVSEFEPRKGLEGEPSYKDAQSHYKCIAIFSPRISHFDRGPMSSSSTVRAVEFCTYTYLCDGLAFAVFLPVQFARRLSDDIPSIDAFSSQPSRRARSASAIGAQLKLPSSWRWSARACCATSVAKVRFGVMMSGPFVSLPGHDY